MNEMVERYFNNLKNPKQQDDLMRLRHFLLEQLPDVTEQLQYGMPHYLVADETVCGIASQKNYMSLYMDMDVVEAHRDDLGGLNCGKSCIRFTKFDKLPLHTIAAILRDTVDKRFNTTV